ncbi:MAG TPA: hypothetical protein VHO27_15315 [Angustibacter sp.]|nr:hypothetical protein [Angustibacter sp.]
MSLPSLPDVPRERRRTATAVAVGAFGVLCLLALVLGLRGLFAPAEGSILTSAPPPQPSTGSTAGAAASAGPSTPSVSRSQTREAPGDLTAFSSPSGNIRCEISSQGARCDIATHGWTAPAEPGSCTGAWGDALQVTAEGAGFACASGALAGGTALSYGRSLARGEFRCDSTKDGMTCTHGPSRHAFSVARAAYHLS